jgi:hypothetical protein
MCILLLGLTDVEAAMYFIGKRYQECEENISYSSLSSVFPAGSTTMIVHTITQKITLSVLKLFVFVNLRI